ncbi:hypothetical protein [Streptomyces bauhiniae]|uniref:hypothetical protein n=1 Tax=Streptomyces bauhiniae TaxID=2340725 RepID=UPI00382DE282
MDEYAWPTVPEVPAADLVRESWEATVAALPVEARITGEVIGRQRFGVFIRIDGVPNAIALAEITAMPHRMDLPSLGAFVSGAVLWHAAHNHQIKVRLDEWLAADE